MIKAALYIRVSTLEQAKEGYSIKAQTEKLKAFALAKDYSIYNTYIDPGESGAKLERPALQQMIRDIKNKQIDVVLVYKLDRLSRSQKDTLYLIEDVILKNNVDFVSMQESFDTSSPFGRAMIGILSVFAQLERDTITERLNMGLVEKAKSGQFIGNNDDFIPTGYKYTDGKLLVDDYEAIAIQEIFKFFLDGKSLNSIATQIGKRFTMRKKMNSAPAIKYALENRTYIGEIVHGGIWYKGLHEPIISQSDFTKAQEILKRRQSENTKAYSYTSLLSGFIYCGNCGARYKTNSRTWQTKHEGKKKRRFYECYSRSKNQKHMVRDENCKNPNFDMNGTDALVIKQIMDLDYPELRKNLEEDVNVINYADHTKEIKKLESQRERILDMYEVSSIDKDEFLSRIKKVDKALLEISTTELTGRTQIDKSHLLDNVKKAQSFDWTSEDIELKRKFIESVVSKITFQGHDILIEWRF